MKLPLSGYVWNTVRLWIFSILELLLVLPVWILFQVYVLPKQVEPMWLTAIPLLSLVGILLRKQCSVRWKQLLAALILGTVVGALSSGSLSIESLPLGVAGSICAFLGMTADSRDQSSKKYWIGIVIYFVATIVFGRIPNLEESVTLLTWCGSLCLLLTLFISNSSYLQYSTLSKEGKALPKGLQRNNRMYVIVIGIVSAVLAAGVGKAIGTLLWNMVRSFFGWISNLFSGSSEPLPPPLEQPQTSPELPFVGDEKPGLLAAILDVALYVAGAVLLGVAAYYGLRWLYRNAGGKLKRAMDALLSMLRRENTPKDNTTYLDEEKSVFTWEQTLQGLKDFWSTRLTPRHRKDRWEQMNSETERVRWLYRHWLHMKHDHGYEVKSYLTPKETEGDILKWTALNKAKHKGEESTVNTSNSLIELYEKVRYGEENPSANDVAALKDKLKL
ncbi:hypothetical protein [Paenibacillus pseudetheri]|uniref:DUF4129 domain-containing protein n=1 Tax=Paenibacillus pseudetheri TaxID=2897682 RepID=A0ABM9BGK1_9BACL|nr:hypothetical protein [Paenibacillus pseudetheri]CAH1057537.1 hypothetical protein PAECIP111894_03695 [Paenibacillus pseudetheri]